MSIDASNAVWDSGLAGNDLLLALALADHARADGSSVRPSIKRVCRKTKLSRATIQRYLRKAEADGWLQRIEARRAMPWIYRIVFNRLPIFIDTHEDNSEVAKPKRPHNETPNKDSPPHYEAPSDDDQAHGEAGVSSIDEAGGASPSETRTFNNQKKPFSAGAGARDVDAAPASAQGSGSAELSGASSVEVSHGELPLRMDAEVQAFWLTMRDRLRALVPPAQWESWLRHLKLVEVKPDVVIVAADLKFRADWTRVNFQLELTRAAQDRRVEVTA